MGYLKNCNIGHRDISLENVLCHPAADGNLQCMLIDFDQAVQLNRDGNPIRYFLMTGKDCYRAPEIYMEDFSAVPSRESPAVAAGYEVAPADMFSVGVCLFCMHTRTDPPWSQAINADKGFVFMVNRGIEHVIQRWGLASLTVPGMDLLDGLLKKSPVDRWKVERCLDSEWFAAVL